MAINTEKLNLYRLQKTHHQLMRQHVSYKLGAKAVLTNPLSSIKQIDCSGLVRLLVYYATDKKIIMPDGSWNQRDFLLQQDKFSGTFIHRISSYSEIEKDPSKLYLCTMDPTKTEAGHIWFVNDGFTMESHGGVGPAERPWNTPILKQNVDYVFEWDHIWNEAG